jgi:hypothetical protein
MTQGQLVIAPRALTSVLRSGPIPPTGLVRLLANVHIEIAFRELVHRLLPADADNILRRRRDNSEAERAWAFSAAFERQYFPIYEVEELEPLVCCIPFQRMGWSYDTFHDVDYSIGTLMLRALCAEPFASEYGARVALLEAVQGRAALPRQLLFRIPGDGLSPAELHAALDGTSFLPVAEFADWTWGQTGLAFLDCDDEVEVVDVEWTDDNVRELTTHWRQASALMDRVTAFEHWLEADPAAHFTLLLETALNESGYQTRRSDADDPTNARIDHEYENRPGVTLPARAAA